jgi:hypothetical protein
MRAHAGMLSGRLAPRLEPQSCLQPTRGAALIEEDDKTSNI